MVGSGVGLVLQLFSCFTGDESAMELWLLLSSGRERKGTKLNPRGCFLCSADAFRIPFPSTGECNSELRLLKVLKKTFVAKMLQISLFDV